MSWYRTGTVAVTNGSKTVTGVGTLWTTAVNAGDAFALVDANLNPTGAWYEVDVVVSNTEITLKQSYAGTTGSNNQFCIFNLVGNMTTPSFAQRLATFFASFQSLIDKPTATPTALGIPIADANGDIDSGWLKDASTTVKGVVELATTAEVLAGVDTERGITPATLTAKILGTVSQVGGVPTGAVIERGSNANGDYTKFADGMMVCRGEYLTINPVTATVSTWYESRLGVTPVFYPSTFVNLPAVSCSGWIVQGVGGGEVFVIARGYTNFESILKSPHSIGVEHTKAFSYLAIGRWY